MLNSTRPYTPGAPLVAHTTKIQPANQLTVRVTGQRSPRRTSLATPTPYRAMATSATGTHNESTRQAESHPSGVSSPGTPTSWDPRWEGALRDSATARPRVSVISATSNPASLANSAPEAGSASRRESTRRRWAQPSAPSRTAAATLPARRSPYVEFSPAKVPTRAAPAATPDTTTSTKHHPARVE